MGAMLQAARLAGRIPPVGRLLRWLLAHMNAAVLGTRLRETGSLLAIRHPQPEHAVHILILPKRTYASLLDLPPEDTELLSDLIAVVRELVRELGLEAGGYRLVVNGGRYQEVPVLHFHLIADRSVAV